MAAQHLQSRAFPVLSAFSNADVVDISSINPSQLLSSLALALGTHQNPFFDEADEFGAAAESNPSDDSSRFVALAAALRTPDFVGNFAGESKWSVEAQTGAGQRLPNLELRRQSSAQKLSSQESMWGSLPSSFAASEFDKDESACQECMKRHETAAAFAAYVGHLACLKALAVTGHDSIFNADSLGRTSLFYAAASPDKLAQTDCCRLLLSVIDDDWIDVGDKHGDTPLAVAACRGRADAVHELLSSGAQIGMANKSGQTALHACSSSACMAKLLRFTQADMLYVTDQHGRTPLMLMCIQGNAGCLKLLIGADDDGGSLYLNESENGNSPLHAAAASGDEETLKLLLATLDLPGLPVNFQGDTPIEVAYHAGHIRLAVVLLQYEAWLSGDYSAIDQCSQHMRSVTEVLQDPVSAANPVDMSSVSESQLADGTSKQFSLSGLAVAVDSPVSSPKRSSMPLSPTAPSIATQAAWLAKGKIPQIQQRAAAAGGDCLGIPPAAALPRFSDLRSSKLRLPPLQQSQGKVLSPLSIKSPPAAIEVPERRLSSASSVHSRRQSLARQRSLKAAALIELSPMPQKSAVFVDK